HTYGHVALHLPDRDAVITGDALVTLDPYTALTGPRLVAGAATADASQALNSLEAIGATDAKYVLPGHGNPWSRGAARAAAVARRNGMA
ncbi:MAG: MBL fold metallo-hydrolase, partial [Corynebacterium sp.]|nr:MBL fold metallo-hydrolase [Corynebacterium sp.]